MFFVGCTLRVGSNFNTYAQENLPFFPKKNPRINTGFNELKKPIFAFLGKKATTYETLKYCKSDEIQWNAYCREKESSLLICVYNL